jgi:hypothetical protein
VARQAIDGIHDHVRSKSLPHSYRTTPRL